MLPSLLSLGFSSKFTGIVIKIFAINVPSQSFLGHQTCHLRSQIFFTMDFLGATCFLYSLAVHTHYTCIIDSSMDKDTCYVHTPVYVKFFIWYINIFYQSTRHTVVCHVAKYSQCGHATDKCVLYRNQVNTVFTHL